MWRRARVEDVGNGSERKRKGIRKRKREHGLTVFGSGVTRKRNYRVRGTPVDDTVHHRDGPRSPGLSPVGCWILGEGVLWWRVGVWKGNRQLC